MKEKKIGEILLEKGLISKDQLNNALRIQKYQNQPLKLGLILIQQGYISKEELEDCLYMQARQLYERIERMNHDIEMFASLE